jgi:hypothetical protein
MVNTVSDTLRHYLASLAFRFRHVIRGAPEGFGDFKAAADGRTPREIVRHMTGLLWFVHYRYMPFELKSPPMLPWQEEVDRFLEVLALLDEHFVKERPLRVEEPSFATLFQGPLVDVATHIGQLALLRRLAGSPVEEISYMRSEMRLGEF